LSVLSKIFMLEKDILLTWGITWTIHAIGQLKKVLILKSNEYGFKKNIFPIIPRR
jgi:hypothetical protein